MTTIQPLDSIHAITFNRLAAEDDVLAGRLDSALRTMITAMSGRKIAMIKTYRDFALVFGGEVGLLEAKSTIDTMMIRMAVEIMRTMLTLRVDSVEWERLDDRLFALDPSIRNTRQF